VKTRTSIASSSSLYDPLLIGLNKTNNHIMDQSASKGLNHRKSAAKSRNHETITTPNATSHVSSSPSKVGSVHISSSQLKLALPRKSQPPCHELDTFCNSGLARWLFVKDGAMADFVTISTRIVSLSVLAASILTGFLLLVRSQSTTISYYFFFVTSAMSSYRESSFFVPALQPQIGAIKNGIYKLVPSTIYTIPDTMSHIGDKSDRYASLRKQYDAMDLTLVPHSHSFTSKPMHTPGSDRQAPYDIYNCPYTPPRGYPYAWRLTDILSHWPANETEPRMEIYQGLCVFDYNKDYTKALHYRKAELPFVVRNDPQVRLAAARWTSPGYMSKLLGPFQKHRVEYSENSHFMYWKEPQNKNNNSDRHGVDQQQQVDKDGDEIAMRHPLAIIAPVGWKEPTTSLRMTYDEFVHVANVTDDKLGPDQPHWYFRFIACGEIGPQGQCDLGSTEFTFDELPFFQPKPSLYIVDSHGQQGIHCRFGMKGVIATNHYDASRNTVALLGGERRYILNHPDQCHWLALHPKGHPSACHSAVDWTNPEQGTIEFPQFSQAQGNEVVLQAGEVLYLPTHWFHYIVSLRMQYPIRCVAGIHPPARGMWV
jgi:Cupin-like domain